MGLAGAEWPTQAPAWSGTDRRPALLACCVLLLRSSRHSICKVCPRNPGYVQCDDSSRHTVPKGALRPVLESLSLEQDWGAIPPSLPLIPESMWPWVYKLDWFPFEKPQLSLWLT